LLLTDGPRVYQIFEKELSRKKDVIGFIRAWMKAIGQKLMHADMVISLLLLSILCRGWNIIRNLEIPTHLALRKKQDIVKGSIEWMQFRYPLQWFSFSAMKNNIPTV